jgi:DNA-binding NtrC family response regulator
MGSAARILIVDDEPHVRAMLAATLDRQGYLSVQAGSAAEAFELIWC